MNEIPSFREDHISQIPALQLLIKLGFIYLSPEEALKERGGKSTNIILENILKKQLHEINSIQYKGKDYQFSDANISNAVNTLKNIELTEGYINATQQIYDILTLGKSLEQSIEQDKKSFTLNYIDWRKPERNAFHVTAEYSVLRSGSKDHYRPDIILFINGIPIVIIECKSPNIKEPLDQAISQNLRNQQDDGIRSLYKYAQVLMGLAVNTSKYATNGTDAEFWSFWKEKIVSKSDELDYYRNLSRIKNTPLTPEQKNILFTEPFNYARKYFEEQEKEELQVTNQDEAIYNLCRMDRLLELIYKFIIFDGGEKKIARYPQYFGVKKTLEKIKTFDKEGRRLGGVNWKSQGSGKSLEQVWTAQQIILDKEIVNPKIVLVTDRVELEDQIYGTFKKCSVEVEQATSGKKLSELLESNNDGIITTIINKFVAAIKQLKAPLTSKEIFVLVDESHRSQYGEFAIKMRKALPNASFIGFTGTPLMKKEKSTAAKFGGMIDTYTIDEAVADGAVIPLLYEGRHAIQTVNEKPIDNYFSKISEPLNDYQKLELKKKFATADQLNLADQKIYCIAWDISKHFDETWGKESPFKGQLVTPNKDTAIKYKEYLDEINLVSSDVLISPPDDREGNETAYGGPTNRVQKFWKTMIDKYGNAKNYDKSLRNDFRHNSNPQIIIVVDKLLTGFDNPRNIVLYLTRNLREHTLLQAIARVNRRYAGKDFGFIIDYFGILENLDDALTTYTSLNEFDEEDLKLTLTHIKEEIAKLPQSHSDLWTIFKEIKNKYDEESYEQLLSDNAIRQNYYDKLSVFARRLKIAFSSMDFHETTDESILQRYREDAKFFLKLRVSVKSRYSDSIDYRQYEQQVQKLIDKHVTSDEVIKLTDQVNIFDRDKFEEEVEKLTGETAKADTIASRTTKTITERWDEDPIFYKKMSEILKKIIDDYRQHRIDETERLKRTKTVADKIVNHTNEDIPEILRSRVIAQAFYGITFESLKEKWADTELCKAFSTEAALTIDDITKSIVLDDGSPIIDWGSNYSILGKLKIDLGDFIFDELKEKYQIEIDFDEIDKIVDMCVNVAKKRYI
jgi:type I restriction enzyme R subunit